MSAHAFQEPDRVAPNGILEGPGVWVPTLISGVFLTLVIYFCVCACVCVVHLDSSSICGILLNNKVSS